MLDALIETLREFASSVRLADLLDVAVVSAFLYAVISWLRQDASRETSRRVMVAVTLFTTIYLLANLFEMYLVKQVLEVLVIVFLLAGVVVFQSEIRRMLDRIGTWGFFSQTSSDDDTTQAIDILTEATARMADIKMGALMAIKGREPWERQVQGGIELGGRLSQPLLYSIFHHDTPGHDGVALIEGNKITTFAAHLPLSSNVPEVSKFGGTRHAAALGLAEQCDALVIVVSEERGTISVAEGNSIDEMGSAGKLKERLNRFWREHYDGVGVGKPKWWTRPSLHTALLSVVLASILWLVVAYQPGTTIRNFSVPIEYRNLEEDWTIENPSTNNAQVALSGTERAFRLLEPSQLTVSFNMADVEAGRNELVITEDNLNLPSEISLYDVQPRRVTLRARQLRSIEVPISIQLTGTLPDSLNLVEVTKKPGSITLLVPEESSSPPKTVQTEPIDLQQVTGSTSMTTQVIPPEGTRLPAQTQGEVTVQVKVRKKEAEAPS